jgi:hypothetical protein
MFWKMLYHMPAVATSWDCPSFAGVSDDVGYWDLDIHHSGFTTFCAAFSLETTCIRWHKLLRAPFISAFGGLTRRPYGRLSAPEIGWALIVVTCLSTRFGRAVY